MQEVKVEFKFNRDKFLEREMILNLQFKVSFLIRFTYSKLESKKSSTVQIAFYNMYDITLTKIDE